MSSKHVVYKSPYSEQKIILQQAGSLPAPTKSQDVITVSTTFLGQAVTTSGFTFYNVTPGKKLFVTSLNMVCKTGGADWYIYDNLPGAQGNVVLTGSMSQGTSFPLTFPTPIQFTQAVTLVTAAAQTFQLCFTGWEEPL